MGRGLNDVLLKVHAVDLVHGEGHFRAQPVVHGKLGGDRLDVLGEGLGVQLQLFDAVVHGDDLLHEGNLEVQTF